MERKSESLNASSQAPTQTSSNLLHLSILSLILLISGYCSLVYQVVWIRDFRMIFGGTTGAMAAVLAVFMGGLGLGGAILGRRIEKSSSPLFFYSLLEIAISITAALTPVLLSIAKRLYFETGGEIGMGYGLATLLRGGITIIVIGLPCFLMGGILPAAAKHLQHDKDRDRKITGWLYGINIVGALTGVFLTTFVLLEKFGNSTTLIQAAILNFCIGIVALILSRIQKNKIEPAACPTEVEENGKELKITEPLNPSVLTAQPLIPSKLTYGAAFLTGLIFFMLELVWYRMSTPLTGGSVYALGMVLLVALLGLALGGGIYAIAGRRIGHRPGIFALLAALQAIFILIPYLMGDLYAWYVARAVSSSIDGSWNQMLKLWFLTVAGMAFLPSLIAGIQFPLLLSLLGRGGDKIGSQLGNAYAWNTAGAILGSLLGGFLLLPLLGAEKLWVISAVLCVILSLIFLFHHLKLNTKKTQRPWLAISPMITLILIIGTTASVFLVSGPGAYWRHNAIGFGRVKSLPKTASERMMKFGSANDAILQQWEGRETCVAVSGHSSRALINNGKSDSSVHGDRATTIGLSLIPALIHPTGVKRAAIIGAGTGVSAGWMAAFPGVEKVDLLEIEPKVIAAQHWFADANLNALDNPAVEVIIGDARETLATKGVKYDTIISEPSNLTRSGICDFYTLEYYQQCSKRLNENGLFVQWVQGYNLDITSLGQVIKTMYEVFPRVELWITGSSDLILIGSFNHAPYELEQVIDRMDHPIYQKALARGFLTDTIEGFFARFIVDSALLHFSIKNQLTINTDDHNTLEFRVAKESLSSQQKALSDQLMKLSKASNTKGMINGFLRDDLMREELLMRVTDTYAELKEEPHKKLWQLRAFWAFEQGQYSRFDQIWQGRPRTLKAKLYMAMAASANPAPLGFKVEAIQDVFPAEAQIIIGIRNLRLGNVKQGFEALRRGLEMQRANKWAYDPIIKLMLLRLSRLVPFMNRDELEELFTIIEQPFPSSCQELNRQKFLFGLSCFLDVEYKRRALKNLRGRAPTNGIQLMVAADLPENTDAKKVLNHFYRIGGKLSAGFTTKRKPGPGLKKSLKSSVNKN